MSQQRTTDNLDLQNSLTSVPTASVMLVSTDSTARALGLHSVQDEEGTSCSTQQLTQLQQSPSWCPSRDQPSPREHVRGVTFVMLEAKTCQTSDTNWSKHGHQSVGGQTRQTQCWSCKTNARVSSRRVARRKTLTLSTSRLIFRLLFHRFSIIFHVENWSLFYSLREGGGGELLGST